MKYPKFFYGSAVVTSAIVVSLVIAPSWPPQTLLHALMQTDMDGGQNCINNLVCINVGTVTATTVNTSNLNAYNITATNLNVSTINSNNFTTLCNVQLLEVFSMTNDCVLQGVNTNRYWMDMAHTNSHGQVDIYATLTPTNDVQIELPTNGFRGALLSFNVLARGSDRMIFFPTNFQAFNTNEAGMARAGSRFVFRLTNGNEFRCTIQSNDTYSVMTKTFGQ